jgi:hypothetical protein
MEFQNKEFKVAFISGEKVNAKKWNMMRWESGVDLGFKKRKKESERESGGLWAVI